MLRIYVEVHQSFDHMLDGREPMKSYYMDHDDQNQRRVLGEQCRNIFEAGQCIVTAKAKD